MFALPTAVRHSAVLLAFVAAAASAQPAPRVVVEAGAVSQRYSTGDDQSVSEVSVPVGVVASVLPGVELRLRTVYASVSGDGLESLSGLGDTQMGIGLRRDLGGALVDLALTTSLPTGQTALTDQQFATSATLALDDFAFALPSLGQGTILSPGLTLAVPVGQSLALGVGAAYSARSAYTLFADDTSAYSPADEVILTAGFDAAFGRGSTFTLEGSYVTYGDDGYAGETFSPGDKLAATMRISNGAGAVRSSLLARYRHVADGAAGPSARPVAYLRPSQAQIALGLALVQEAFDVGLSIGARYYGSISDVADAIEISEVLAEQQLLLDLGIAPAVALGPNAELQGAFTYTLGLAEATGGSPLSGYRVGGSVRVGF